MISFFVKFWEVLKSFVLNIIAIIVFFLNVVWNDIKRIYGNFSNNIKILWKFIVTGSVGDLAVQPSLIAIIVYIFSTHNDVAQVYDPGDYNVTLVGWSGTKPSDGLISLISEYQMISIDEARKILNVDNLRFVLALGIKETRVNELKNMFSAVDGILEIIRVSVDENIG
jgi:hypothetical protein